MASIFVFGALLGTTTTQGNLNVDAARATACPWFPAETVSIVRLSPRVTIPEMCANAPRTLKECVYWMFSSFRKRCGTSAGTIGVLRIYGWIWARIRRKSGSVIQNAISQQYPSTGFRYEGRQPHQ